MSKFKKDDIVRIVSKPYFVIDGVRCFNVDEEYTIGSLWVIGKCEDQEGDYNLGRDWVNKDCLEKFTDVLEGLDDEAREQVTNLVNSLRKQSISDT